MVSVQFSWPVAWFLLELQCFENEWSSDHVLRSRCWGGLGLGKVISCCWKLPATGRGAVGSTLWERKARELMGSGVFQVNLPLWSPGTSVTGVLLSRSLFSRITQVIHTREDMAFVPFLLYLIYCCWPPRIIFTTCLSVVVCNRLTDNLFCPFTLLMLKASYLCGI